MNNQFTVAALVLAGMALMACKNQPPEKSASSDQGCRTAIKYAGRELSITGLKVPSAKFELASAVWKDVALQQAQAITQALDVMQFGDCQLAKVLPSGDPMLGALLSHRDEVMGAIIRSANAFGSATSDQEAAKALADAKSEAEALAAKTPPAVKP